MADKRKEIRGNETKVDTNSKIDPLYITNTITMADRKKNETPIVDDDNVAYARKFQEENEK